MLALHHAIETIDSLVNITKLSPIEFSCFDSHCVLVSYSQDTLR